MAGTDEGVEADAAAGLHAALERDGVRGALRYLNQRTRHRYTGIYRFDPPMLRSIMLYDRENPALQAGSDTRIELSYCSLVRDEEQAVTITDADQDARVVEHPARARYQAYCGTPVRDGEGRCVGTLCHFDSRPRLVPESELPLLEHAAELLTPYLATA